MSIAASGGPAAATLPATRSSIRPCGVCSASVVASLPKRRSAAALRKTTPGSIAAKRSLPARGRGSIAGARRATTNASMPTTRIGTRRPAASNANVSASTTGLATATPGVFATPP